MLESSRNAPIVDASPLKLSGAHFRGPTQFPEGKRRTLESIFNDAPVAMALLSGPNFQFEQMNPCFIELIGARDIQFRPFDEALPELRDFPYAKLMHDVFESGIPFRLREAPVRLSSGSEERTNVGEFTFDLAISRVNDEEGTPYGVLLHLVDRTEVAIARRQVQEREAYFQSLTDASPAMVWIAGVDGACTYFSKQWFEYTGVAADTSLGMGWLECVHPDDRELAEKALRAAVEVRAPLSIDYRLRHRYGEFRYFSVKGSPRSDGAGKYAGYIGTLYDIDDQKRISMKLTEAVRARDEFLSVASHELKTPLTSLGLQAQLLQRLIRDGDPSAYSKARIDRLVHHTDRQVGRLTRLVDDMLDIARIRSGRFTLERESLDLAELVRESIERLQGAFSEARCGIPTIETFGETTGRWDHLRIEQVITNLFTNAARYGRGGSISVRIEARDDVRIFSVRDEGIGIAPEDQEKIFGRFERAANAASVSGLGLGLFITKQIVEAHGGRIWVESELGRGSTFFVEMPA